jgi:transcriptional regulator with XRE-family HTH domain
MPAKIPKSIRERVIKQWLQGISRDQIAKDNDIGAGTVSSIIKDTKQEIPDIDLLREVALVIKNDDLDLSVLANSIRLKKKLDDMGLNEDQIESLIENINIHCFKRGLTGEEFINTINKTVVLSQKLRMPVDELPNHIIQLELELEQVEREIEDVNMKEDLVLQKYGITMVDLEEFKRDKPLIDRIKQLEMELEREEKVKEKLVQELRAAQIENIRIYQEWRASSS